MFKDKGGKNVENKLVVEVKVVNALVNMVMSMWQLFTMRLMKNMYLKT
jgi:hypothetical protein